MKLRYIQTFLEVEDSSTFDVLINGSQAFYVNSTVIHVLNILEGVELIDTYMHHTVYIGLIINRGRRYKLIWIDDRHSHINMKFTNISDANVIEVYLHCVNNKDGSFNYIQTNIKGSHNMDITCINGRLKSYKFR